MAKKHVISCRVSDDEFKHISTVANQLNIKKSAVLKLALHDNLKKYRPIKLSDTEKAKMEQNRKDCLDLLGKISSEASVLSRRWLLAGDNLNQIAHRLNMNNNGVDFALNKAFNELKHELSVNKLIKQNNTLLGRIKEIWQLLE